MVEARWLQAVAGATPHPSSNPTPAPTPTQWRAGGTARSCSSSQGRSWRGARGAEEGEGEGDEQQGQQQRQQQHAALLEAVLPPYAPSRRARSRPLRGGARGARSMRGYLPVSPLHLPRISHSLFSHISPRLPTSPLQVHEEDKEAWGARSSWATRRAAGGSRASRCRRCATPS